MSLKKFVVKTACLALCFCMLTSLFGCFSGKTPRSGDSVFTLSLNADRLDLSEGESFFIEVDYTGTEVPIFHSMDDSIATVTALGVVHALSAGSTEIYVVAGSELAVCTVFVTAASEWGGESSPAQIERLVLSTYSAYIHVGEKLLITAYTEGDEQTSWSSLDPSIATVSGGVVTAVSVGSTTITAQSASAKAEVEVTVTGFDDPRKQGFILTFSDEFSGSRLNEDNWGYMLGVQDVYGSSYGPRFWGNNERQYYSRDAVSVSGGVMSITATRQNAPEERDYVSARISTRDKFSFTYGYIEARISLPAVKGLWPAFWMLPQPSNPSSSNNRYGSWAASGEIDVMEAKGRVADSVYTTLHYGNFGQSTYATGTTRVGDVTAWHTYGFLWRENAVYWYIDGLCVFSLNSRQWWSQAAPDSPTAPFDVDFYILLNLAVGGNFDGGITPDSDFTSASMLVDYVRVYKEV